MRIDVDHAWLARVAVLGLLGLVLASPASAQPRSKSIKTEGKFLKYSPQGSYVVVKVTKPGSGKLARRLKRGKPAKFKVKAEGSVLSRTTVSIRGRASQLDEIAEGTRVNVYWRPEPENAKIRFARKIDVWVSAIDWGRDKPGDAPEEEYFPASPSSE